MAEPRDVEFKVEGGRFDPYSGRFACTSTGPFRGFPSIWRAIFAPRLLWRAL